jgi:CYTH domain-containing protein
MTSVTIPAVNVGSKYARAEIERRFLLAGVPDGAEIGAVRRIDDRYLDGTRLRLRRMAERDGPTELKLTQKLAAPDGQGLQGALTTIYLSEAEHAVLAALPGAHLAKSRLSIGPYGVDVFAGHLDGLVLAEVEFASAADAAAFAPAAFCHAELTADRRFTGGELVRATRAQVAAWTAEYGIELATR